ncbi:MAG: hypothetical protein IMF09_02935 [Proteobacteria bacterium]|nr:hypothetical protein [Pseudomonadota bacterium]
MGKVNVNPEKITVSGMSAGAQMAHQLHMAYPEVFSGAGLLAGGPFGCANGSLVTAMERCMGSVKAEMPVPEFIKNIRKASADGKLGDTGLLADDRVWIFHGALDTIVAPELGQASATIYTAFIQPEQVDYIDDVKAAHTFPTVDKGSDCDKTEAPFIGNCNYDAVGKLLQQLYGKLIPPTDIEPANLIQVELPGGTDAGLLNSAYLYMPQVCKAKGQACKMHLVLHGCGQSSAQIDKVFIQQSGYLPWAESNNIVLAFPQVTPAAVNPLACWDWWGYTGVDYRWRNGLQMQLLVEWLQQL